MNDWLVADVGVKLRSSQSGDRVRLSDEGESDSRGGGGSGDLLRDRWEDGAVLMGAAAGGNGERLRAGADD